MSIQDKIVKYTTTSKTAITLVENSIDNTSTTLVLSYQGNVNINRIVNNNLIHLVENFCGTTAPSPSVEGQLWLDTNDLDNKQEFGRLKIYMKQDSGMKYMDVAGTVMDKNGNLRHMSSIEAFNDLNNIPKNTNKFPEDADYYKFLTTKYHCDDNYLSGLYDNSVFYIRGPRYVTYVQELVYRPPFDAVDTRTLVQKKFIDQRYLFGVSNNTTAFNITADKKIYYDNPIEMTYISQLITKIKCEDAFAKTIDDISKMAANIKSTAAKIHKIAYDPFDANDLDHSGVIAIANEIKRLVAARPTTAIPGSLVSSGPSTIVPPPTVRIKGQRIPPTILTADISDLTAAGLTVTGYSWSRANVNFTSTTGSFDIQSVGQSGTDTVTLNVSCSNGASYTAQMPISGAGLSLYQPEGKFVITGTNGVGATLTADTSHITTHGTVVGGFHYKWVGVVNGANTDIGTDSATLVVPQGYANNSIFCELSFNENDATLTPYFGSTTGAQGPIRSNVVLISAAAGTSTTGTVTVTPANAVTLTGINKIHVGVKWCKDQIGTGIDGDFSVIGYSNAGSRLVSFNYAGISDATIVPGSSCFPAKNMGQNSLYEDQKGFGYDGTKFYSLYDPTNTSWQFTTFADCYENESCDIDLSQLANSIDHFDIMHNGKNAFGTYYKCQLAVYDISTPGTSKPLTVVDLVATAPTETAKIVGKLTRSASGWTFLP